MGWVGAKLMFKSKYVYIIMYVLSKYLVSKVLYICMCMYVHMYVCVGRGGGNK